MNQATAPSTTRWRDLILGARAAHYILICAGTWLVAADALMTATIMPSVAKDIGGYAFFGWAVAIYMLGSILAGATAGRLALRLGLRMALAAGGLAYAAGCVISALSSGIVVFLGGRLLQGVGGGWVAGLGYVAVTRLFPTGLWPRALSGLSGVWGGATLISPLIGGLFAQAGFWRGAFWLFAVQGGLYVGAVIALIASDLAPAEDETHPPPWLQIAILAASIIAIAMAGLVSAAWQALTLGLVGLALLALFLRLDGRAKAALLPRAAARPTTAVGAGLAMVFCLSAASTSFTVYGPALFQGLYGASPVTAGYVLGCEAFAWTAAALLVAASGRANLAIRVGAAAVTAGVIALAVFTRSGPLPLIALCGAVMGAGFGLCWSFTTTAIAAAADEGERALASGSVPTMQMIGVAAGAAAAGAIASLLGFASGVTRARAEAGAVWLFAAFVPLAILGCAAAWRLSRPRRSA